VSAGEIASLVVAAASLLTALGTFSVSIATLLRMAHVETSVNGHSEALNTLTGKAAYAEGLLAGGGAPLSPDVRTHNLDSDQEQRDHA
jgi:hypothetical protein